MFGAAFLDLDDNYWYKSTDLNYTAGYFQDYPTMIDTIEDGSKAIKILQVDNNGEHRTKLIISAKDKFGEGEDQVLQIVTMDIQDDDEPGFPQDKWWHIPDYITPFNDDWYVSSIPNSEQKMYQWDNSDLPSCMNSTLNLPNSNPYYNFLRVRAVNESDAD